MPEIKNILPQGIETGDSLSHNNMPIELYVFPGEDMDQVTRVGTNGCLLVSLLIIDVVAMNCWWFCLLMWLTINWNLLTNISYIINTLGLNVRSNFDGMHVFNFLMVVKP